MAEKVVNQIKQSRLVSTNQKLRRKRQADGANRKGHPTTKRIKQHSILVPEVFIFHSHLHNADDQRGRC